MKMSLPLYQHPTLVVLVDDSASFIASLEFQMDPQLAVKCFSDPHNALKWLDASYRGGKEKYLPIRVRHDELTLLPERRTMALDVDQIYRIAMNPRRFHTPAVVVVDYAMPQMNGLDFCRALKDLPCKKILLTGEANEMVAVDAFNQGLIDRYLKKGDPCALDRLELEIAAMQQEYFLQRSRALKDFLARDSFSFLSDDTFAKLVQELASQHGFVEHFLFPEPAGMLFFNADGRATLMVVETKVGLMSHLEAAQDYGAPQELRTALKEERIVPFFWRSGGMYTEVSVDWEQYCQPAQLCSGSEDYYWALFNLPEKFLDQPVYSYRTFQRDRAQLASL